MKYKFLYNILLTLGIVLMVMSAFAAYNSGDHLILALSAGVAILLLWLKIQLLKHVRQSVNKKGR